jgi:hypothetical protein
VVSVYVRLGPYTYESHGLLWTPQAQGERFFRLACNACSISAGELE